MQENKKNVLIDELSKNISKGNIDRDMVDKFARQEKAESMQISEMVRGNLANLEGRDKPVFDALTSLQNTINELNPNNFKVGFFDKLFGGAKGKMKKYFQKFDDNKELISEIIRKLDSSKEVLERDNVALDIEAKRNAELAKKLQSKLEIAQEANNYIESVLSGSPVDSKTPQWGETNTESTSTAVVPSVTAVQSYEGIELTPDNKQEVQNKILFPLKQKIMDFQQQILVHTQGEIALKTLINNNKELINSVDRTKSVTLNALNVAIITAQGLEQQQRVLKAVQDINAQTSDLIAHTGAKLKEQGNQIQQSAASAMLDMDKLKGAFNDVLSAMNDMQNFKINALPKMQENINLYDKYLDDMKRGIKLSE
ncbi:toxic anion resistance family protein [Helicobacter saguini]|uniref:Toxic anion resistance family protein n=1 Tax=Helicobacter saguini TaxID=1548018 RepID=A0A347VRC6_9HELI|nr:toxic anion resistance protein [Helicobacter saguini]MWV62950.1 toxic anion resistance family protein [Helicobacter saguini]MWV66379.1 toxic anion resistance family protein [Helicobacter saguini]MWV68732.1 toxic anion resistance family protein [Helicobacter saguini]MWV71716.1 toxic anion resistance family protein [Helicobacter saguini]TLD92161.1 toxic anion resistance family protein [Helicobacter saguini]